MKKKDQVTAAEEQKEAVQVKGKKRRAREAQREIRWDRLDNTAHLFPVIAGESMSNVYLSLIHILILAILILASVFDAHIYAISSLFIGFIIFAIPIIFREEKNCLAAKKSAIPFVLIGVAIVTAITYFNPSSGGEGVSLEHLTPGLALFVFLAGMIAICAMVLPGISGSTLLLIMGLYLPVVTAIKDILHLNFAAFPTVFIFGCGVLVGIFGVVKLIRKALDHFRAQTIYLIIGLMLGSIYAVVMGPTTLEVPQPAMTLHDFNILFFVIGGALIIGLQKMKDLKA